MGPSTSRTVSEEPAQQAQQAEKLSWKAYDRFMRSPEVLGIGKSLEESVKAARKEGLDSEKLLLDFLKQVSLSEEAVYGGHVLGLVNLRYFDVDSNKMICCAMPLVRREVARFVDFYDKKGGSYFQDEGVWEGLKAELEGPKHPSVVGIIAERCTIGAIVVGGGWKALFPGSTSKLAPEVRLFQTGSEHLEAADVVANFKKSGAKQALVIFVPVSPYYISIDLVAMHLTKDGGKKAAIHMHLVKAQITLSSMKDHEAATAPAMEPPAIMMWASGIDAGRLKLALAYIYPGERRPPAQRKPLDVPAEPRGATLQKPKLLQRAPHQVRQIAFGEIHPKLKPLDRWPSTYKG